MKTLLTLLFPASLLLAGCTADRIPGTDPALPPVTGTVPLIVESATVNAQVTTRAATTLTGGIIGVFLSGGGYADVNNSGYAYDVSSRKWSGNIFLGGASAWVCAYYPWREGITNSTAFPLTSLAVPVGDTHADISFATSRSVNGTQDGCSTSFAMTRAYAKMTIVFRRGNYPGTCQVQKVELKNLLPSATLNIGTGVYSTAEGVANSSVSMDYYGTTVDPSAPTPLNAYFLLVPCTPAAPGTVIVITVDGKTMTTTIPAETYRPVKGECKNITITLQGTGIDVASVTTEDWVNSDLGPFIPIP